MRALIIEKFSSSSLVHHPYTTHDLRESAVLLPLIEQPTGMTLLLTKRAQHLQHHPGQIGLPGGVIEPMDADPVAAALRETYEEVGIPPARVQVIGTLESVLTRTGFLITPVVGFVGPDVRFAFDHIEVEELIEIPLSFLLNRRIYQRISHSPDGFDQSHFYAFAYEDHIVWGATARIIVNFVRRLGVVGIP